MQNSRFFLVVIAFVTTTVVVVVVAAASPKIPFGTELCAHIEFVAGLRPKLCIYEH